MEKQTIKHAVILMAGKGTRFLPATKIVAKEMFPIGNIPAILYLLKECLDSGIKEVTLVISKEKKNIKYPKNRHHKQTIFF
jgi:UTP--glucose-1-phosphate uridylyltransferase